MDANPQDPPRHAGQVVRRVLLRRNIAVDPETAQLAAAVQAVLRAGTPSRPPRRGPRVPPAGCEPLFKPPLTGHFRGLTYMRRRFRRSAASAPPPGVSR
jgi:hypothetical protein